MTILPLPLRANYFRIRFSGSATDNEAVMKLSPMPPRHDKARITPMRF